MNEISKRTLKLPCTDTICRKKITYIMVSIYEGNDFLGSCSIDRPVSRKITLSSRNDKSID